MDAYEWTCTVERWPNRGDEAAVINVRINWIRSTNQNQRAVVDKYVNWFVACHRSFRRGIIQRCVCVWLMATGPRVCRGLHARVSEDWRRAMDQVPRSKGQRGMSRAECRCILIVAIAAELLSKLTRVIIITMRVVVDWFNWYCTV